VVVLDAQIIQRTLRAPAPAGAAGDGTVVVRQLDAVLLGVGFACSRELLDHLSGLAPGAAIDAAVTIVGAVRELVGDHVAHNTYFRDFPTAVPDTTAFWIDCLVAAVADGDRSVEATLRRALAGVRRRPFNLLTLPRYGRYQHSYHDMLAVRDAYVASAKDRTTVLHLGRSLDEEASALYLALAGSTVPLDDADRRLLEILAAWCVDGEQPREVPIRENLALINRVRLTHDRPLRVDTATDVLRLACALAGGDVSLAEPTRFRSLPRPLRRRLLAALDSVVRAAPAKVGDVGRHRERWKRLGERLHPHEYPDLPHAQDVFAVARRDRRVFSLAGQVETALAVGDVRTAVGRLSVAPGLLFRSVDRLLRACPDDPGVVLEAVERHADAVSGRVLLGLREHLQNRSCPDPARIFVNRAARAWVTDDVRAPLDPAVVQRVADVLDDAVARRFPRREQQLVVDPAVLSLAVPLSGRSAPTGFGSMPRGSVVPVAGDRLRFFVYWRQAYVRTDLDLSALLLGDDLTPVGHVSWTNLTATGAVHSGDLVEAPDGASEFIEIDLSTVPARYVVPQVNLYAGEGFDEVAESFFGFMERDGEQHGRPFEPRTVRMKSDLRGSGRVALPLVFRRDDAGGWTATWMHLFLHGGVAFNAVETNKLSTTLLVRSVLDRRFLTVGDLVALMGRHTDVAVHDGRPVDRPVTYVGLKRPDGLPDGSEAITVDRLGELVPE
jgi:hypothetical protein